LFWRTGSTFGEISLKDSSFIAMFIQQGKQEGWLQADLGTTYAWLRHNGVKFEAVGPRVIDGRGTALVASEDIESLSPLSREILTVPKELVLSSETVNNHALFDQDLRQVIESLGDWGRVCSSFFAHAC
jgi:hypothetical protein